MKSIRKLNNLGRAKNEITRSCEELAAFRYWGDSPRYQARGRRDDKIRDAGGSLADHFNEPIVFTRDVSIGEDNNLQANAPKRKAIARAKHWLAKMKARHAPGNRRILRAEKVLERRVQVDENRKEREANGTH
jgi:hypothetical protein